MKTIANHIENQLTANIVISELEAKRSIFLVKNMRTGNSLLTSNPIIFGGERVKGGIGIISGNEGGMYGDVYSYPIDEITERNQVKVEFAEIA